MSVDRNDIRLMLARAFDRVWTQYYSPSRVDALSEDIARPSLAKHLVALVRTDVRDEDALVDAGFRHLVSLALQKPGVSRDSDKEPPSDEVTTSPAQDIRYKIDRAKATFLAEWRIHWGGIK